MFDRAGQQVKKVGQHQVLDDAHAQSPVAPHPWH